MMNLDDNRINSQDERIFMEEPIHKKRFTIYGMPLLLTLILFSLLILLIKFFLFLVG